MKKMTSVLVAITLSVGVSVSALAAHGDAAAGKKKSGVCAACHGNDGNSVAPNFPKLAGQHEDYLAHSLHAYKTKKRVNAIMEGQAANLSDQDIADLAAYFSSQTGLVVKH